MKKEEIHFGDLKRWIFGQAPPEFMIEVLIRTSFIYLFLLVVLRLAGKRMADQMTITELAVMVSLGAIVSPVMQLPDRGIFFGVLVLLCALLFQRGLNYWAFRNKKVEEISQGTMSVLVKDGRIMLDELEKTKVTKPQLFSMLRKKNIHNLGKVKRAYLEACGILSVYENETTSAGLSILPSIDPPILNIQQELDSNMMACLNCGNLQAVPNAETECKVCHAHEWTKAYVSEN